MQISCVAEAKASTTAKIATVDNIRAGSLKAMATRQTMTRLCAARIQARRLPSQSPISGSFT